QPVVETHRRSGGSEVVSRGAGACIAVEVAVTAEPAEPEVPALSGRIRRIGRRIAAGRDRELAPAGTQGIGAVVHGRIEEFAAREELGLLKPGHALARDRIVGPA